MILKRNILYYALPVIHYPVLVYIILSIMYGKPTASSEYFLPVLTGLSTLFLSVFLSFQYIFKQIISSLITKTILSVGVTYIATGAVLKIFHWPGAGVSIIAGLLLAMLALVILFIQVWRKKQSE